MIITAIGVSAINNTDSYYTMRDIANLSRDLMEISYLAILTSVLSYSREAESQADAWGLLYTREAGYITGDSYEVWQSQLDEDQHSDFEARRNSGGIFDMFATHPMNELRIIALREQDRAMNGGTASTRSAQDAKAARRAYRDHIRPFLSSWLEDDLKLRDYGSTLYVVDRLLIDNDDAGVLNYYKGEAYRRRAKGDDLNQALAAYRTAVGYPDAPKQTYRQIGEIHRRNGDTPQAIEAFELYVAGAPDAEDAWLIQDQIDTLKTSSGNEQPAATTGEADTRGL
ncbi:hypothetical protein ABAC460_03655 [Asticcacaulis sp. AC460]|nr:hypothetical protein ABAC460_03655 [Asticcacaulis sp. AC460]